MTEYAEPHSIKPSSEENYFDLESLDVAQLQEGDVVMGLDEPSALGDFEDRILEAMGQPIVDSRKGRRFSNPNARHALIDEFRPKGFNGRLLDTRALVLSGYDPDGEYDYSRGTPTLDRFSMLLVADMKSTGRKEPIGSSSLAVTYKRNTSSSARGINRQLSRVKAGDVSEGLTDSLRWESSAARHVLTSVALGQTVSAGLPTLGKNR